MNRRQAAHPSRRADPLTAGLIVLVLAAILGFGSGRFPVTAQVFSFWTLLIVVQGSFVRSSRRVARFIRSGPAATPAAAARTRARGRTWRYFAVAGAVLVLGNIIQLWTVVRDPLAPESIVGTDAQIASIAVSMILLVAGMLRHPMDDMGGAERLRMRIDVATLMAAAVTYGLWIADLPSGPHDAAWALEATVSLLVQPGLFLVVIFAVLKVILSGSSPFTRTAGILSGAAAVLQAVFQAVPVPLYVEPPTRSWMFAANVLTSALIAIGARVQERDVRAAPASGRREAKRPYSLLPYGALAAVWALAIMVLAVDGLSGRGWVIAIGAMTTTVLVIGRQVAAFRHVAELLRERDELAAQLTELAFYDGLTKLANRGLFMQRLQDALAAGPVTVFLIDLDDFKPVNDRYGHATGDQLLIEVGQRLRDCVRDGETVARLGGDEFAVLVDGSSADRRAEVADGLARALSGSVRLAGTEVPLRASIGMATGRHGVHNPDSLLHEADMAMYAAKNRHRPLIDSDLV
ncbi:GGDEF domain-containing protein [Actinoplanes sp. NPDC051475]|uniref:GGDEF domain-containing protein n=1 Tax=Actinoplanes sp. NPDC051475 TaxID=3157225 RepID=UPI00344E3757